MIFCWPSFWNIFINTITVSLYSVVKFNSKWLWNIDFATKFETNHVRNGLIINMCFESKIVKRLRNPDPKHVKLNWQHRCFHSQNSLGILCKKLAWSHCRSLFCDLLIPPLFVDFWCLLTHPLRTLEICTLFFTWKITYLVGFCYSKWVNF